MFAAQRKLVYSSKPTPHPGKLLLKDGSVRDIRAGDAPVVRLLEETNWGRGKEVGNGERCVGRVCGGDAVTQK